MAENNKIADATPNKDIAKAGATNPMTEVANMARKYATGLVGDKRAQQFAFQIAIMTKDPKNGSKILACSSESVLSAMMACVHLDLMPNTSEGLAYIIPYGNTAQFQLGYKGLVELAYRSGVIKSVNAELVFAEDTFDFSLGTDRKLVHKPNLNVKDRTDYSKATAVYATAKLDNGEFVFEVLTKPDLDKVRKSSKAGSSGPWTEWPEAMAKKTAVKRLLKLLPSSTTDNRFKQAAQWDSIYESGKRLKVDESSGDIIDGEVVDDSTIVSEETRLAIESATDREELMSILYKLPVSNRKAATELVNSRLLEIVAAKKK